jgi:AcrR family transcriptional regulator
MASAARHRPSRRHLIVAAAVKVFADKGFAAATVAEIAHEAHLVPTAVYYHFTGKDELFEIALRHAMDSAEAMLTRAATAQTSTTELMLGWLDWVEHCPAEARMLQTHLGGAAPAARALTRDYEARQLKLLYPRRAVGTRSARTLAVRTMIGLALATTSIGPDGPLSTVSRTKLRQATATVATRIAVG